MVNKIDAFDSEGNSNNDLIISEYNDRKHRHYVSVSSKTINGLKLIVDSGADTTIISKRTLCNALDITENELNDKLIVYKTQTLGFANGEKVETKIYPCCILNAKLGRLIIPRFYFTILDINSNDLLGSDFLDFCKIEKDINSPFRIVNFDYDNYKSDFVTRYDFSVNGYIDSCELNYFGGE